MTQTMEDLETTTEPEEDATKDAEDSAAEETTEEPSAETTEEKPQPSKSDLILAHYAEITEAQLRTAKLQTELFKAKSEQSSAKKAYEASVDELCKLIQRGPTLQRELPLGDPDDSASEEAEADETTPADPDTSWRDVDVDQLDIADHLVGKLRLAGIENVGQLEDARAEEGGLTSLDKIGQASADKIEEALLDFLAQTRDAKAMEEATDGDQAGGYADSDEPEGDEEDEEETDD